MIYIKKFNELNSSTYISAANKLAKLHPERSKRLRSHASSISDELEGNILYLDPRKFEIEDDFYYITGIKYEDINSNNKRIIVNLESDTNKLEVKFYNDDDRTSKKFNYSIQTPLSGMLTSKIDFSYNIPFTKSYAFIYLKNRKEAKLFIKIIEDNLNIKIQNSINSFYKSF